MHIALFTRRGGRSRTINLFSLPMLTAALLVVGAAGGAVFYGAYQLGVKSAAPDAVAIRTAIQSELAEQRETIAEFRQQAREDLDALALRLGEMQAHVIRLDALGERLTEMAHLDKDEFNFEQVPAQGGPETMAKESFKIPDFLQALEMLDQKLVDREQKLAMLESTLMNRRLQAEVLPAGRPTTSGWISSFFGVRTDPFTGRPARHEGIDVASRLGSEVVAVASGVVTWSGPRYGYGNLVEINHGNGYVTRYAHNKENLVEVGQTVKKGEQIAKMGSSGRSTGPHVHFEVLIDGKQVDPLKFVRSAQK